jgi:hypothetical protein
MEQPDKTSQYDQKEFMEKLAAQGHKLATDILTYASLTPTRDPYTPGLVGTISTTAITLSSFISSRDVGQQEVEGDTIRALLLGVKAIFDRVETALKGAEENGEEKERGVSYAGQGVGLVEKLGGMAEADPLHWRFEDLRGYLVVVFDSVRYLGLKKGEKG